MVLALTFDKVHEAVFALLLDADGEGFVADVVADVVDGTNGVLELIDTILNLFGLDAAFADEVFNDALRGPGGFVETGGELGFEEGDAHAEEFAPRRKRDNDVVVGADGDGDIFAVNTKAFFTLENFNDGLRNGLAKTKPVTRFFDENGKFNREVDGISFKETIGVV